MLRSTRMTLASLTLGLAIGCGIVAVSIESKPVTAGGDVKVSKEVGALRARLSGKMRTALSRVEEGKYEDAREITQRLHDAGDVQASYLLGFLKENGLGGPQDKSGALNLYQIAANEGVADAQFALGNQAASRGQYELAYKWLEKAANQDLPQAQTRLATLYAEGRGGAVNAERAFKLFSAAAEQGDAEGLAGVGIAHLTGAGASLDYPKAAVAFEQAANLGHAQSQYNLALLYDSKLLGKPDPAKTHHWMKAAAENGMAAANVALGLMAHNGGGSDASGAIPAEYFAKAAEAGDPQGMFLFAVALAEGDGLEKDETTAVFWLDSVLAAHNASRELKASADALRERLAGEASPVVGSLTLRE